MKSPISRASDKLANDLVAFVRQLVRIPVIGSRADESARADFTAARATVASMEHFVRTIVREEIRAWELLREKGEDEDQPHHKERPRKSYADAAVEQAIKTGLRRVANWIEDVEGRI